MVHLLLSMPGWLMCTLQRDNKEEQTYTKYACHQYKEAQITTVACMNMYMYMYAHLYMYMISSQIQKGMLMTTTEELHVHVHLNVFPTTTRLALPA